MKLWKCCLTALSATLIGVSETPSAAGSGSAPVEAAGPASHFDGVPLLSRITVSSPDGSANVAIAGAAGAVPASSHLFLTTLDTGHWTSARASADGSFTASLPAVAGSSILIEAERSGNLIADLVARSGVLITSAFATCP